MRLVYAGKGNILAEQVMNAYTFFRRLKGLMFTKSLPSGCCLHIRPCRSVHTFFMKYTIDILYLDAQYNIIGVEANLKPGKIGAIYPNSVSVIELPEGAIQQNGIQIGQAVWFEPKTKGER
jgi:uncharacterized membrane protein (UPF0127 family)